MKRTENGYFTVEASLVMPVVLGVVLMTVYLWIFQYDRCRQDQDTGLLAMQAAGWRNLTAEERCDGVIFEGDPADPEVYLGWDMGELKARQQGYRLEVERTGRLAFPLPGWNLLPGKDIWEARSRYENRTLSPVKVVRSYQETKELLQMIAAD